MEWTEQFDPALDFPVPADVSVRYAICSTPRSGSHFLGQLLYATGRMRCPLEYFNRRNIVRWQERAAAAAGTISSRRAPTLPA
jgi:LPS sulfotransferase NodH